MRDLLSGLGILAVVGAVFVGAFVVIGLAVGLLVRAAMWGAGF